MTPSITSTQSVASISGQSSPSTSAKPKDIDKNMFLKLLVTQLRNQDPLNPSEGTEFIAQLAQFQQLEQSINAGQDIAAMRNDLEQFLSFAGAEPQS